MLPGREPDANTPIVVLDTNVVLDWFWFVDNRAAVVADLVQRRGVCWLATAPMRAELDHVLLSLPPWRPGITREQVLTAFDAWATLTVVAPPALTLRCTDHTDQKFIDLAVANRARWLFSRDRAVLKLARRAMPFGCSIIVPERLLGPQTVVATTVVTTATTTVKSGPGI